MIYYVIIICFTCSQTWQFIGNKREYMKKVSKCPQNVKASATVALLLRLF
jgi:hypothetical protein